MEERGVLDQSEGHNAQFTSSCWIGIAPVLERAIHHTSHHRQEVAHQLYDIQLSNMKHIRHTVAIAGLGSSASDQSVKIASQIRLGDRGRCVVRLEQWRNVRYQLLTERDLREREGREWVQVRANV
jgi:hypothetical protein